MTTHAIDPTSEAATAGADPSAGTAGARGEQGLPTAVRVLRNMDLAFLAIALPIFIAAGWPILGWITGAGLYVGQRLIGALAKRKAEQADDPRTTVGLLAGSMIGRGWLVAGAILAIGLTTESDVGLSSAVLFLATFTVALTMTLATGGAQAHTPRGPRP